MKIRELREKANIKQADFARMFRIPLTTLQRWEYGYTETPRHILYMVCKILEFEGYIDGKQSDKI